MRLFVVIMLTICCMNGGSQTVINTDTIGNDSKTSGLYSRTLFGDSLCSSFCIVIKNEVKAHKHQYHSEHVLILEGEGVMKLDGRSFTVKKGDLVFIPKNVVHSVKTSGRIPLKVLSIQAPLFNGSDRVFVEENK